MLLHDLLIRSAANHPHRFALGFKDERQTYNELLASTRGLAGGLQDLGLVRRGRVAIWLPKQLETVHSIFACSLAGGVFVPINPVLKPAQVVYQLQHSDAQILITDSRRLKLLSGELDGCPDLKHIVLIDDEADRASQGVAETHRLSVFSGATGPSATQCIDVDMASILYTSGSTGRPKGVLLSHRNMVAGAISVSSYLSNNESDRILSVLPLSFDAGLSQLTTAFLCGAYVQLMDYLLPKDVIKAAETHGITGITGVPSLWNPISKLTWPESVQGSLRYIANTGGAMPVSTTRELAEKLPESNIFLMYGLTEAFRSTFLPPSKALEKPTSIGTSIPNAEVMVINEDGNHCAPGEHGELVHRGVHVALGYWKNPEATAERFKPAPSQPGGLPLTELAVWSGDTVYMDDDGDIYFVSRDDAMIKTSGYRVSPTEVELEALAVHGILEAAAVGAPHPDIGQAIVLFAAATKNDAGLLKLLRNSLMASLPTFMVPQKILLLDKLPLNPNGKVDRPALELQCQNLFKGDS